MAISLSTQMSRSLISLMQTNKDIEDTQTRMNTGKRINTASDDIATYFKARDFSEKAKTLNGVNGAITQSVKNLNVVDKALDNMQTALKGALQILKDAKAKAVPVAAEAKSLGDQDYANVGAVLGQTGAVQVAQKRGDIVSTRALSSLDIAANLDSSTMFQVGDTVAVSLQEGAKTVTKYFRAVDPNTPSLSNKAQVVSNNALTFLDKNGNAGASEGAAAVADGSSQSLALGFRDLASFGEAVQKAFGYDTLTVNVNQNSSTGRWTMGFNMAAGSTASLSFAQVTDQVVGRGTGNSMDAGAAFNFATLFGKQNNAAGTRYDRQVTVGTTTIGGQSYSSYTYDPIGPAQAAVDAAQLVRSDAASFFKQTLYGLANTVKDAYLPGYANILKGENMTVAMNVDGDVNQSIKLTTAVDPLGLGFTGYSESNGQVSVSTANDDFRTDARLQAAIDQTNAALTSLSRGQGLIAAGKTAMESRVDLNTIIYEALTEGANALTSTNTTEDAVMMAALQNRQSVAVTILNATRQSDQYLQNLLR